ncbi:alcohol dehydrogenase catalytic domain-containing protein [Streptomyces ipomoeae]|jgi:NADPH:quinone reductase-like Zn-dependent oxidoreductase|uniref:Oxidoreductase, zinc-binding dehydrogenase family protein n=1 Tax=Streptomyces ipomoeae 91-03 TaxID=698759 RepID=L1KH18_9ACTN|nr:alcohol dehydrogenase catalytic domain-containing protein [Streptomyces ipomoeae]EKX60111.1 oxidoreductase, zinc-binding dehydrogenase family protein [Streptomyces ipomoeae 91-03]MDX2693635.1 alcohol dehydrogenase catalytic domain-containing protein [Streptomyces ipomoeae]MDX2838116.1 alcohol dehydrogenase catalytic domain-containing protein [Streptomyces ipomoeae]
MRAVTVSAFGTPPVARDDVPEPVAGPGQVLVRVQVSSVNWFDVDIAHGMFTETVPHKLPITLGRDFAGIVEAVGEGVRTVEAGDEVFGEVPMGEPVHEGAWAELIATGEHTLIRKPAALDTATAGVAAVAATTAVLAIDALDLAPGDTVLVVGATGGVGGIAVQLARAAGATVLAPGLPEDEDYLRGLGVSDVLPRGDDVIAAVRKHHPGGVDALLDAVTAYEITPFADIVRDGGRIASPTDAAGYGPGCTNVTRGPCTEILGRVARHLVDGTITIPVQESYDLADAAQALTALAAHHTRGKIAVRVA